MRAFDFMVALWGSEYRSRFLRYCLTSLRAPGNLPRLSCEDGHRLLIATPTADWNALQQAPELQAIRAHIIPEWVPISDPASTPPGSSAAVRQLNTCQTLLVQEAHRRGSMACMLWPDVVFSDGYVVALQRWAADGHQLVLCASLRHCEEAVVEELRARGIFKENQPLAMPPRSLADLSVRHLHPEVLVYDLQHVRLPSLPAHLFVRVPEGQGLLLRTFDGQPLMMDMAAVCNHNTQCLEVGLFEYDYLDENFRDCRRIHIIRDSDECGLLSLTPAAVGLDNPMQFSPRVYSIRAGAIKHTARGQKRIRAEMFKTAVKWHGGPLDEAVWSGRQGSFDQLVNRVAGDLLGGRSNWLARLPGDLLYLHLQHRYLSIVGNALKGDVEALRRIIRSIKRRAGFPRNIVAPLLAAGWLEVALLLWYV